MPMERTFRENVRLPNQIWKYRPLGRRRLADPEEDGWTLKAEYVFSLIHGVRKKKRKKQRK